MMMAQFVIFQIYFHNLEKAEKNSLINSRSTSSNNHAILLVSYYKNEFVHFSLNARLSIIISECAVNVGGPSGIISMKKKNLN